MELRMDKIRENAQIWLGEPFDEATRKAVAKMLENGGEELQESFYRDLEFGTGGMRGIMGVGSNRINAYTLGKNTQGLSNYLRRVYPDTPLKVAIAYDCRHNSKSLAETVARVFAANDITVYLFSDLRPTPELSFAVKHLGCQCGIVLTASHNPPEYNGYKVYWTDGGQIVPPQDKEIVKEIESLSYDDIRFNEQPSLIKLVDKQVDEVFIAESLKNGSLNAPQRDKLKIVFTSLHGTSITIIPEVLKRAGYSSLQIVKEQATPDGDFPTVLSPNPEEPEALSMATAIAEASGADIVIGTDPDCDRLGIAVRNDKGAMQLLNGNQTMILMTKYLLDHWKNQGKLTGKQFIASTIVSTPMMAALAKDYGIGYKEGLTGFKWIAKMIEDYPEEEFIGGGEESFGFMVGDFVRDKDAVTATLLACEIAAIAKAKGSSFYSELLECYVQHGLFTEKLISLTKKGITGAQEIQEMMRRFRNEPPDTLAGEKVIRIEDYQEQTVKNMETGEVTPLDLPQSNVLIFYTSRGTKMAARPSGTEPKIKFYFSARGSLKSVDQFDTSWKALEAKIDAVTAELQL